MTQKKAEKARVATYDFAGIELEILQLPDGSFGIGVSQFSDHFQLDKSIATRTVKALLGAECQLDKTTSELHPRKINYLTLEQFEKAVLKLAFKGNDLARHFVEVSVGLSLIQVAHDAFGLKYEAESRQRFVRFRAYHKSHYRPHFTDWLKADYPDRKDYGKQMNYLKVRSELPLIPVDQYDDKQIEKLNEVEHAYHVLRKAGFDHETALKQI